MQRTAHPRFRPSCRLGALLQVLLLLLLAGNMVLAEERKVPESYESIQAAIDAAVSGDVITIAPGRYFESINLKGKSIVLKGRGPDPTIFDGSGVPGSLIKCVSGEGPFTRLDRLIIRRGSGDASRYGERTTVGGGLLLLNASPTLNNCRFEYNQVSYNGGAIYASNSNSQFHGCTFVGNTAEKGGGVFANRSKLEFVSCSFEQNNAAFGGGAIFSDNRSVTTVTDTKFIENRASFNGGALYDYDSATTVTDSIFLNNVGAYKGGAAYHGWRSRGRIGAGNDFRTPNDDVAGSGRSINQADPLGACFIGTGCILTTQSACQEGKGAWAGPDTRCDEAEAPEHTPGTASGDLNQDGRVDVRDMAILLGSWGRRGLP